VLVFQAEIIPIEPGRVMLPRKTENLYVSELISESKFSKLYYYLFLTKSNYPFYSYEFTKYEFIFKKAKGKRQKAKDL